VGVEIGEVMGLTFALFVHIDSLVFQMNVQLRVLTLDANETTLNCWVLWLLARNYRLVNLTVGEEVDLPCMGVNGFACGT
jgi:hypothetical protein